MGRWNNSKVLFCKDNSLFHCLCKLPIFHHESAKKDFVVCCGLLRMKQQKEDRNVNTSQRQCLDGTSDFLSQFQMSHVN